MTPDCRPPSFLARAVFALVVGIDAAGASAFLGEAVEPHSHVAALAVRTGVLVAIVAGAIWYGDTIILWIRRCLLPADETPRTP